MSPRVTSVSTEGTQTMSKTTTLPSRSTRRAGGPPSSAGRRFSRPRVLAAATAAALAALAAGVVAPAAASADPGKAQPPAKPLTVMTRNIYLGGDIMRPLYATAGKSGAAALVAFGNANDTLRDIVDQTNFPVRSRLLAREIATERPDVVGLQEVAQWRSGPLELDKIGTPNAEHVDYDFLATLTADLAAAGADYDVVGVQQESDVEGPAFEGNPFAGTMKDPRDVRLTMRDVMLVRGDHGLKVLDKGGAQYQTRLPVSVGGVPFLFIRGYNWADVKAGSMTVRVINTHLESASSDIALGQAMELMAGPAKSPHSTVVVCDCNSDPLNHTVKPGETQQHSAPYDYITGPGGFTDEWLRWKPADQGWTSGLSELVNDPTAAGFDHRIDMVFARRAAGGGLPVDKGWVTGTKVSDRDPTTGLWPSDHGGVVLRLRGL